MRPNASSLEMECNRSIEFNLANIIKFLVFSEFDYMCRTHRRNCTILFDCLRMIVFGEGARLCTLFLNKNNLISSLRLKSPRKYKKTKLRLKLQLFIRMFSETRVSAGLPVYVFSWFRQCTYYNISAELKNH